MKTRYIVALVALTVVSSASQANNAWCDSRPTRAERERCYSSLAEVSNPDALARGAVQRFQINFRAIEKSKTIPEAEKTAFLKRMSDLSKKVDATCKDNSCVALNISGMNNQMVAFYNKYNGK